ncbi:MAG: DNA polymerase III subunit gamma/tau [Lewinellaceae bacterium]|nr:DNA polymerase III subunit gamma/tau [Saprospiraceae bacterium]MCB9272018.1 DNA polymerase III subunit gamma/tau [Lewinellaceae bacterium]HPQ98571.1 DNA polymerase III subunit gamma/tau [Saprospiraceae bacterium]
MSSFVVSARKYRPTRFSDMVGQEHIVRTLQNAIRQDKLAHAFLFCGPRGVGKTSAARILARTINCMDRTPEGEACGTCATCKAFAEQQTFNIIELDAASYNSVEHIRNLTEQVRFQPQQGAYKVFIIDEVHMLSPSAFNAFLKTLEEPPPYALFILATTEKHKIIPTILSRCQIFDFRRIPTAQTVSHLEHICTEEGIQAEDEALHIIAQKGEGSLRDSLSIFDRLVSFTQGKLTYDNTIENLNVLDYDYYFKMVEAFMVEAYSEAFVLFDEILRKGFEPETFVLGLGEHLRQLLVCKQQKTVPLLEASDLLKSRYASQANQAPLRFLLSALQIINETDIAFPRARNKRLHVELALLKMNYAHRQEIVELSAEKKNPDLNGTIKKEVFDLPGEVIDQSPIKKASPVLTTEKSKTPLPANREEEAESLDTPLLISLEHIEQQIRLQEDEKETHLTLTQANVEKLWQTYAEEVESPSLKSVLMNVGLELDREVIKCGVGTQFARTVLQQENDLVQYIRDRVGLPSLQMEIFIDPDRAPEDQDQKRKILTNKEKFDLMVETNPNIKTLQEKFTLRIDHNG